MTKATFGRAAFSGSVFGVLFISLALAGFSTVKVKTPAEECFYTQYTQHEDIARFLSTLDALSREVVVRVAGRTREARDFPSRDLYLCLLTETGVSSPEQLDRSRPTVMVTASQHGNEQSAKEAALEFVRDLAVGNLRPLLKQANFLVMPQCNPYGNWADRRTNEQGLDLNRDHIKLESEEAAALCRVFRAWMPEATLDMHEKGDDFYRVSLGCVSNINIAAELQDYSRKVILRDVEQELGRRAITFGEYTVREEIGINTSTGARISDDMLRGREMMLRYSTVELNDGRHGPGIYQTLSFIMECASRHDLPTLRERTGWQSSGLRAWAESVVRHGPQVLALVTRLRSQLLARARVYDPDDVVHLRMDYARDPGQPQLERKRFQTAARPVRGILKVDKKAGETLTAEELAPYPYPAELKVEDEIVKDWFPRVEPRLAVVRPLGYIIPGDKVEVVETLLRHGVVLEMFVKEGEVAVEVYEVKRVEPEATDWLPPKSIEVEKKTLTTLARKGDFFVSCGQPSVRNPPLTFHESFTRPGGVA